MAGGQWVSCRPVEAPAYAGTDFIIAQTAVLPPFISFSTSYPEPERLYYECSESSPDDAQTRDRIETARQLAQQGGKWFDGRRNPARGKEAPTAESRRAECGVHRLDLDDPATHTEAAMRSRRASVSLDILINPRASTWKEKSRSGPNQPAIQTSWNTYRQTFRYQPLSTRFSVTHALLPLVKKSDARTHRHLSSVLGSITLHAVREHALQLQIPAYDALQVGPQRPVTVRLGLELKETPIQCETPRIPAGLRPKWADLTDHGT